MKMKHIIILLLIASLIIVATASFVNRSHTTSSSNKDDQTQKKSSLLKKCPDEWIANHMPNTEETHVNDEYFILNGEREEIKNYDVKWIRSNCSIEINYVY